MTQKRGEKQSENVADDTKPTEVAKTRANYEGYTEESHGIGEKKQLTKCNVDKYKVMFMAKNHLAL